LHIPDGFINGTISIGGFAATSVICGIAIAKANKEMDEKDIPLLGICASFIFASQLFNFPVAIGISGHFLGALLTALLLGPLNAVLVMAVVLTIQALLFADGGVTTLGVNIFNLGIVGGAIAYALFRLISILLPKTQTGFYIATTLASWFSIVAGASLCAIELSYSGVLPFNFALTSITGIHAIIGIAEAVITTTLVSTIITTRPDLVRAWRVHYNSGFTELKEKEAEAQ